MTSEQQHLLNIMLDIKHSVKERDAAGRELAAIGDPRPGVSGFDFGEDYWCKVPAGEFIMGSDQSLDNPKRIVNLDQFFIAKYPITVAQYRAFIKAPDDYHNADWLRGLHIEGLEQQKGALNFIQQPANSAAERISWYDAMAFSRWLTATLGYEVTLPTEEQWEKAGRGTDGREYPWGDGYTIGFANINEDNVKNFTYLTWTTPVGMYPQGASPYGALDMSGNVGEWCLNEYESGTISIESNNRRGVRGGSWNDYEDRARTTFRVNGFSISRRPGRGFRLMSVAPIW